MNIRALMKFKLVICMEGLTMLAMIMNINVLVPIFMAMADPQTKLVARVCGRAAAIQPLSFYASFNSTLPILRSALSSSLHASAQSRSFEPVFAYFQCREYLSSADCLACFDTAASFAGWCYPSSGGFVVYDGCTLGQRSNSHSFDWAANSVWPLTTPCEDRTVRDAAEFSSLLSVAMEGLVREVPNDGKRLFGATKLVGKADSGNGSSAVYGVGQCLITDSGTPADCRSCLQLAYQDIKGCLPAAGGRSVKLECFLRYSDQPFFNESQVVLVANSHDGNKQRSKLIVGVCSALVASCLLLFIVVLVIRRRRLGVRYMTDFAGLMKSGLTNLQQPISFRYGDLQEATGNFSDANKVGRGGFAVVYKGVLRNGRVVAVKKLITREAMETRVGFESEVVLLSNTRHRNLVSLLGFCKKGSDLLLVYEYMEKGSLDKILFSEMGRKSLSWRQRFDIIVGIARGLTYLHEDFCVPIIHRDIKCGNILLDDQLQAKIGDFGLARLFPEDQSQIRSRLAGTLGYAAPEYMLHGHLSEKADIYSFGIIVLEIVSRRRCNDKSIEPFLLEQAWRLYEADCLSDLVDETMELGEYEEEETKVVIQVGLICTQPTHLRPTMSEAVARLLSKTYAKLDLNRPTFIGAGIEKQAQLQLVVASSGDSTDAKMSSSHFSGR